MLSYGLEACPLNKSHNATLDFVANRYFMKLFNTGDIEIVQVVRSFSIFLYIYSVQSSKHVAKFDLSKTDLCMDTTAAADLY